MFTGKEENRARKPKNQQLEEPNAKGEDNYNTMIIKRDTFVAEQLIREHIRKRIKHSINLRSLTEQKIRSSIRKLLEAEAGTEEPSQYTGINVLADILEKVVPTIEDDYKMLTTSVEQRESFRNHIVHAIKNSLRPIEAASAAENLPENFQFEIDKNTLSEKLKIDLTPEEEGAESIEGEFIDIEAEEGEDEFVQLDDQNETGRNFAAVTFKKVEKQIVDAYDMLADEEDQKMFYDYLITNMLLYFDKFEDELAPTLPDTTTPEYEQEKEDEAAEETEAASEEPEAEEPAAEEPGGEVELEI
tara:strand:- start:51 stop:956 length:906 start_codon:yes stop_codon:yes gene_type:complete